MLRTGQLLRGHDLEPQGASGLFYEPERKQLFQCRVTEGSSVCTAQPWRYGWSREDFPEGRKVPVPRRLYQSKDSITEEATQAVTAHWRNLA